MSDHSPEHDHLHDHPVDSVKTYALVLITLLGLTILTTVVAYVDLGAFSTVIALGIACTKMMLVALFFMHVRHSTRLTKLVIVGGLVWLMILLLMTMTDFATRTWLGVPGR